MTKAHSIQPVEHHALLKDLELKKIFVPSVALRKNINDAFDIDPNITASLSKCNTAMFDSRA